MDKIIEHNKKELENLKKETRKSLKEEYEKIRQAETQKQSLENFQ